MLDWAASASSRASSLNQGSNSGLFWVCIGRWVLPLASPGSPRDLYPITEEVCSYKCTVRTDICAWAEKDGIHEYQLSNSCVACSRRGRQSPFRSRNCGCVVKHGGIQEKGLDRVSCLLKLGTECKTHIEIIHQWGDFPSSDLGERNALAAAWNAH